MTEHEKGGATWLLLSRSFWNCLTFAGLGFGLAVPKFLAIFHRKAASKVFGFGIFPETIADTMHDGRLLFPATNC